MVRWFPGRPFEGAGAYSIGKFNYINKSRRCVIFKSGLNLPYLLNLEIVPYLTHINM